jgi:hypothetical protein
MKLVQAWQMQLLSFWKTGGKMLFVEFHPEPNWKP